MIPILTQYHQLQKSQGIKLTGAALLIAPWLLWLSSKKTLSRNDRLSLMAISAGMIYFNASSYLKMKNLSLQLASELPQKIESGQIIDDVLEQKLTILPDAVQANIVQANVVQAKAGTTAETTAETTPTIKPPETSTTPSQTSQTTSTTPEYMEFGPEGFPIYV